MDNCVQFLVKWEGETEEYSTWESYDEAMSKWRDLVVDFENKQQQTPTAKKNETPQQRPAHQMKLQHDITEVLRFTPMRKQQITANVSTAESPQKRRDDTANIEGTTTKRYDENQIKHDEAASDQHVLTEISNNSISPRKQRRSRKIPKSFSKTENGVQQQSHQRNRRAANKPEELDCHKNETTTATRPHPVSSPHQVMERKQVRKSKPPRFFLRETATKKQTKTKQKRAAAKTKSSTKKQCRKRKRDDTDDVVVTKKAKSQEVVLIIDSEDEEDDRSIKPKGDAKKDSENDLKATDYYTGGVNETIIARLATCRVCLTESDVNFGLRTIYNALSQDQQQRVFLFGTDLWTQIRGWRTERIYNQLHPKKRSRHRTDGIVALQRDFVVLPMAETKHFTLAILINDTGELIIFDSVEKQQTMYHDTYVAMKRWWCLINEGARNTLKWIIARAPLQNNETDCGWYAMANFKCFVSRVIEQQCRITRQTWTKDWRRVFSEADIAALRATVVGKLKQL